MARTPIKYIEGTFVPDWLIDLFGRLKISEPVTQLTVNQSSALNNLIITEGEVSGSGTSSNYELNRASTTLTVGTTTGLRRFRTRVAGLYQAGKPLLLFQTFTFGEGQNNVIKRVGYIYGNNGIFLEQNGTTINIVKRSGVTGSMVETRVEKSQWSVDPLDGTVSNYNFDATKSHILFIAFEWLGVGDIVFGFIKDRTPIVTHVFAHPNVTNGVYMSTPALYPTWEIERTIAGGSSESLEVICASLQIEGSLDRIGSSYTIRMPITQTFNLGTANVFKPVAFLSLKPSNINSRVRITDVNIVVDNTTFYHVVLVKNPTISGAYTPTWIDKPDRSVRYWFNTSNALSVTNVDNTEIWGNIASNNKQVGQAGASSIDLVDYMGSEFNDTPELYVVCLAANSANVTITGLIITLEEQI